MSLIFSAMGTQPARAASTAVDMANALFDNQSLVTGASFVTIANGNQAQVFNSALAAFPRGADGNFAAMSTGNAASIPNTGTFADTQYSGGNIRGNSDFDVAILKIDFNVPQESTCLTFEFRFFSEEYPSYIGQTFNDAFIAELDTSNWITSGSAITAPNNFANVSGTNVSVNSLPMSATNGAGTAFDSTGTDPNGGASTLGLLAARTPLTPGAHSLYLSIFDQGDQAYDSAVLFDHLVLDATQNCTAGSFYQDPEVNVKGNNVSIADGSASPSASDDTDFGSANVSGGTVDHIFTIENTGTFGLSLTGSPLVSIGGANASDFSVISDPASSVSIGGSTTFTVRFDPSDTGTGTRTATISIANTDTDENPYNFDVQGTGVDNIEPVATIDVSPPDPDSNTTPTFEFSGTDNASDPANLTFGCAIDSGSYFNCTSPYTINPGLAPGQHTFAVYAIDEAGNYQVIDTTYTWTIESPVDTTAPVVTINTGPASPTNKLSATFTFSGTDNVTVPGNLTFECGIDAGFWLPCSSPKTYTGLTEGAHQFWLRATDEAGNVSTAVYRLWTIAPKIVTYTSVGTQDGWVLESTETSNVGGTVNATGSSFNLGDDIANKQYKTILSFNTAPLPDNAVLKSAVLKIKQFGSPVGTNPFTVLGGLLVDIRKGFFGTSALQTTDFQAAASAAKVSTINKVPQAGWYSGIISLTGRNNIFKTGTTQFRLYFTKDDDNNKADADYMMFVSGNPTSNKPQLIISYFEP